MKRYFLIIIACCGALYLPSVGLAQSPNPSQDESLIKKTASTRPRIVKLKDEVVPAKKTPEQLLMEKNTFGDKIAGEDLAIRKAVIDALDGYSGAVVVMEPQTGKILTMVNQKWVISQGFDPCSTIKLVTSIAGLSENVINADGTVLGSASDLVLDNALAYSNNDYFDRVGGQVGKEKFLITARELGLGLPTGINMPGEYEGRVPTKNLHRLVYSHAYGFEVTPLQLAVLVSEIGNGGRKVTPQVPVIDTNRQVKFTPRNPRQINVPQKHLQTLITGMRGTALFGTASKALDPTLSIAGKTGTCQSTGTFASFAPVVNPQYTVVVVLRGRYGAGKYAAAVAGKIYKSLPITRSPPQPMLQSDALLPKPSPTP